LKNESENEEEEQTPMGYGDLRSDYALGLVARLRYIPNFRIARHQGTIRSHKLTAPVVALGASLA
jgi:hypothetical protein